MARFKEIGFKNETIKLELGRGINQSVPDGAIDRSECISNLNMSTRKFPFLSVRKGSSQDYTQVTVIYALGSYLDTYPHVVHGSGASSIWYRWNGTAWTSVATGLTPEIGVFSRFSTSVANYIIYTNGTDRLAWDGSSGTTLTAAPATHLYCVDDRRLYALKGDILYGCASGDITDWTTANDASQITLSGTKGTATAITAYNDTVISFFEESMHIMYGDDPYNYYSSDPIEIGCVGSRALIQHEGKLYFAWKDGIYIYQGDRPQKISYKVQNYFENLKEIYKKLICFGKYDKYIYISIPYNELVTPRNTITLVYDTQLDIWNVYNKGFLQFESFSNKLLGADYSGYIWDLNSGDDDDDGTAISSEWVSGWIDYNIISRKKKISYQYHLLYLPVGSTLTLYYSTNGTSWTSWKVFSTATTEQVVKVTVPITALRNITRFKMKFVGTGQWYLEYIDEKARIKQRL